MNTIILQGEYNEYLFDLSAPLYRPGKFSTVYKGTRKSDAGSVFIKLIPFGEALPEMLVPSDHPVLISLIESIVYGNNIVLIYPFATGTSLKELVRKNRDKKFIADSLPLLIISLLDGLHYLHEKGWMHGDIRPAHFIVTTHSATLVDFGQAQPLGAMPLKKTSFALIYASPEQQAGLWELYSPDTDLYSFAISLYEILSGEVPFRQSHPAYLQLQMFSQALPGNKNIPLALMKVLEKATSRAAISKPPVFYAEDELKILIREAKLARYASVPEFKEALLLAWPQLSAKKSGWQRWF